jgi:hypothetical protein
MATQTTKITREELESKLKSFQDDLQGKVEGRKQSIATTVAVVGLVMLVIVFLLGKRAGRKKTTIVEIRRI